MYCYVSDSVMQCMLAIQHALQEGHLIMVGNNGLNISLLHCLSLGLHHVPISGLGHVGCEQLCHLRQDNRWEYGYIKWEWHWTDKWRVH